ncbi:MAG: Gfo/Idh/MocA family oxidoreductase [Planctomycetota bacterium]
MISSVNGSSNGHTNGTRVVEMKDNGHAPARPLRVGIAGLGRSGWNIHALTLVDMPRHFTVVAVADPSDERLAEAVDLFRCGTHKTYESLVEDDAVDVMIIATPSHLHAQHAEMAMRAGHHVVAEKPFAMSGDEARRMIDVSRETGRVIAPFHNRRFEGHFLKVKDLLDANAFGDIMQIRMTWHTFSRRWDWQAMKKFGGGALTNNGAHLLDQALDLFGETDPEVFLDLKPGLTLGDADQHMKVVLHGEGRPTIDIELTNASAFPQDRWHIMGTSGGLIGTPDEIRWRRVDWSAMPERKLDLGPAEDRLYNNEEVEWIESSWMSSDTKRDPYTRFFKNLYNHIDSDEPLVVTPESAVRYVDVLDRYREAAIGAL